MKPRMRNAFWPLICTALMLVVVAGSVGLPMPDAAAKDACPPGQSPLEVVSLAEVLLTAGAPPYAKMSLSRISLAPGETLDDVPEGNTAYYVESGVLKSAAGPGFEVF